MKTCSYHPDVEAKSKCIRCLRLICSKDILNYDYQRTATDRWGSTWETTSYELCPMCYYDARMQENSAKPFGMIFTLVSFGIFLFALSLRANIFSGSNGEFGPPPAFVNIFFILFFAVSLSFVGLGLKIARGDPTSRGEWKKQQEKFVNTLESPINEIYIKPSIKGFGYDVACNECGEIIDIRKAYCPYCGDTTDDEYETLPLD